MRVLIVDDEKNIRSAIAEMCESEGWDVTSASNGLSAQKALSEEPFDVVILDVRMPGMDGIELLTWMKNDGPQTPTIMISAFGDVQDAVRAMKLGAVDYLVKPFDPDELVLRVRRAGEDGLLRRQIAAGPSSDEFLESDNPAMRAVYGLARKVAPADSTVLVSGETGTGKEVLARFIHMHSRRSDGPFVPINLGAIPDQLLESELFGFERGAFTGADRRKQGLFELASAGTLFLDEVGELPPHLQVKLLRILQDRKLQRLGGTTFLPIDVRIIAATNRDLEQMVAESAFRQDLYYRLNVVQLTIPPLRERPEDVASLAALFISRFAGRVGTGVDAISPEAIDKLTRYRFPGNVRELENLVERAMIVADDTTLQPRDFPIDEPDVTGDRPVLKGTLKTLEREAIIAALQRNQGHRTQAAEELGITRRTLLNKIKAFGLEPDQWR